MSSQQDGVTRFLSEVQARFRPAEKLDSFWDCEPHLLELASGTALRERINDELRGMIQEEFRIGDWLPNEWVLKRGGGSVLSVMIIDTPRRYIHALPFLGLYAVLGDEPLIYDRYRLPSGYRNDVFDPSLCLEADGSGRTEPGQILRLESSLYAYDFHVIRPVTVLKFVTSPVRSLEWLFSKNNLKAWQANDADLSFTQLRVAADVLGKIAHQSSVPYLLQLTSYPHHAVRWSAVRNLARVDRNAALDKIRAATNDPHPHVRRAATKTLEQLQKKS